MVPTAMPVQREVFRSSATSTWSVRSGTRRGSAPKLSTMASRASAHGSPGGTLAARWSDEPTVLYIRKQQVLGSIPSVGSTSHA